MVPGEPPGTLRSVFFLGGGDTKGLVGRSRYIELELIAEEPGAIWRRNLGVAADLLQIGE